MSYDLAGFERFAPLLHIEDGSALKLERFQKLILADHFGQATELVVVIPKKNGKTTMLAALALFHAAEVMDSEVIIVAASGDQAGIMFRQAEKMLRRSGKAPEPRIDSRGYAASNAHAREIAGTTYEIRSGLREIRCNGGRIKVMAADAHTSDGPIPTLALVDELHRHPDGELYGVLADGLGPRGGRMVTISTAGSTEASPLGLLRARAHKLDGTHATKRHSRYAEGQFALHEWALEPEDKPDNLQQVKWANPSHMQSIPELRRRRSSPSMTPGRWLRFACGIWTHGEEPAITPNEWDRCRVDIGSVALGDEVVLVPSVGHNAAIGIASVRDEGRIAVAAEVLDHTDGSMLVAVEDRIVELCDLYHVSAVHHPLGAFIRSADLLSARGVQMIEAPHSPARLVAASGTFNRLMRGGLLMHDGNAELRNHVLAAQVKTSEQGERYEIGNAPRALIAVAFAVHAASANPLEPPMFVAM
jgi:hypothetical protein